jgi:hypothetical protein
MNILCFNAVVHMVMPCLYPTCFCSMLSAEAAFIDTTNSFPFFY